VQIVSTLYSCSSCYLTELTCKKVNLSIQRFGWFLSRQVYFVRKGGVKVFFSLLSRYCLFVLGLIPGLILFFCMRLLRPFLIVRIHQLISTRIGHLTANTELYVCEVESGINRPEKPFIDIVYHGGHRICNKQLARMWKRKLRVWPKWILEPAYVLNELIPGGVPHIAPSPFQFGRDALNLFEKSDCHIEFTAAEEARGLKELTKLGIAENAEFICLNVRDNLYLNEVIPVESNWTYHNYRDSDIDNYAQAAERLADMGYFVLRMGALVNKPLRSDHPRVIDYACNGMRSDFMDVYLGAKCLFCLSTGSGFDGIPLIFRRPIAYINIVPLGYLETYVKDSLFLGKHHICTRTNNTLSESEIFARGVGFSLSSHEFEQQDVVLQENSPEEITDLALEMLARVKGTWVDNADDSAIQQKFWNIYPLDAVNPSNGKPIHGSRNGIYAASFLRMHPEWVN